MTPQDKKRVEKAYRDWMAKTPRADVPFEGFDASDKKAPTPRKIMEAGLSSGELYNSIDTFLKTHSEVILDQMIDKWWGTQNKAAPKSGNKGPKP